MNVPNLNEEKCPRAGDGACSPTDGDVTPIGDCEETSVQGEAKMMEDEGFSPDHMDIPLPPVEEIYFPEGGFRAWSIAFGVSPSHVNRFISLQVTFDGSIVISISILDVSFLSAYRHHPY